MASSASRRYVETCFEDVVAEGFGVGQEDLDREHARGPGWEGGDLRCRDRPGLRFPPDGVSRSGRRRGQGPFGKSGKLILTFGSSPQPPSAGAKPCERRRQ